MAASRGSLAWIDSILTIWIASTRLDAVMPGRCEASNPESRDSGSGPSDHPGMTGNTKIKEEVPMKLHGYFRSSASYRVRIALNLKGLQAEHLPHHLRKGEQCAPAFLAINPQWLAIIEWLDETHPEPPLLPKDPLRRAKVRAFAQALACDTHPVQNLKVL